MNYAAINNCSDLQTVIDALPYLSGTVNQLNQELYSNAWALAFDVHLLQKITTADFELFVTALLNKRQEQLNQSGVASCATFYIWFDAQAMQLRFNILSYDVAKALPFACKVIIVDSPKSIFEDCINTMLQSACEGDAVEFLDVDDEDDEQDFVMDVYAKVLQARHKK